MLAFAFIRLLKGGAGKDVASCSFLSLPLIILFAFFGKTEGVFLPLSNHGKGGKAKAASF